MANNRDDILAATDAQQADGALLVGGNGSDLLLADGTQTWTGTLQPQNNSGVAGTVTATLTGSDLRVQVQATGLEPNQPHPMHIHGPSSGGIPENSSLPLSVQDSDADGFIELAEGTRTLGSPVLTLTTSGQPPIAAADGSLTFDATFNLDALPQGMADELFPLDMRSVHIHGDTVTAADGRLSGGEVNGTAGYKPTLPVAGTELTDADTAPAGTGAVLRGDNGNDVLIGDSGDDLLLGSRGNDVLAGMAGNDNLVGGTGRDAFVVGQGNDLVVDFETSQDKLVFADGTGAGGVQAAATPEGIQLTAADSTIVLMGVVADPATVDLSEWIA